MRQFLKQVAGHYYAGGDISAKCFIFPNKRSLAFFKKYLGEEVAAGGLPVISPVCLTMNDFFYKVTGKSSTDRVILLKTLYDCYRPLYEKATGRPAESFDEFIFWGGVILGDFADVDKYLVDPDKIFTNIAQYKSMQTDFSFLSETQRAAMEAFVGHFSSEGEYKARFQSTWDILLPLYRSFNEVLESSSRSYEGAVYRALAEKLSDTSVIDIVGPAFPGTDKFVFVGLNALNSCEKRLLSKLRDASLAEFCWDYSSDFVRNPDNKSSLFMSTNVTDYPQAFTPDPDGLGVPEVNVLSVPSAIGQTKQIPSILRKLGRADISTAIVLPDETLLLPLLNSIPPEVTTLNVTMGYPMSGSELWPLLGDIAALQLHLRQKDGKWHFYHKQVWSILSNSLVKGLLGDDGLRAAAGIHSSAKFYVGEDEFGDDPLLRAIFRPVVTAPSEASATQIRRIEEYQMNILEILGSRTARMEGMALEADFAKRFHLSIQRLASQDLEILPATYFRLLRSLTDSESIPFEGLPLSGLQIMGPLETRALDFENVIILSCNEGSFPRRSVASSYIPPELRRGFDLPTYEYQDAVWAYYFYRLIQRAGKVWMLLDSRTEGVRSGEMSRYIRQLELHFNVKVNHFVASAPTDSITEDTDVVAKTPEHLKKLERCFLSASALQDYLCCPARFFYSKIEGLREEDEVSEALDAGMTGTVFHAAMQSLYTVPDGILQKSYLQSLLKDEDRIGALVRKLIMEQLRCFEVSGRNIIYEDIIIRCVCRAITRDIEYMDSLKIRSIRILGLEMEKRMTFDGQRFKGYIDRLDSALPGEIRVVDYKTGKVTDNDFIIDEDNAEGVVEAVFTKDSNRRLKIPLQLYLYDEMLRFDGSSKGCKVVNSIYHTSRLFKNGVENVALNDTFRSLMEKRLKDTLKEMRDPGTGWARSGSEKDCEWCKFKIICGK